ncbi:MAG: hypothetical protein U0167_03655 [bacterium]
MVFGAEADGPGGRWILGSQTWPTDGAGWTSALASRSFGRWPSASSHVADAGVSWLREEPRGIDVLACVGRRGNGHPAGRLVVRGAAAEVGWSKDGSDERAVAALAREVGAAALRVEISGGASAKSLRAGLGGGSEPAGVVAEWRSSHAWRVRGGARLQARGGDAASLEVETSRAGEALATKLFAGFSARRGPVAARLDGRGGSDAVPRWRAEIRLPASRGALNLVADVVRTRVDGLEMRLDTPRLSARLRLPAAGATRGAVAVTSKPLRSGGFRGVVEWERGGPASIRAEWTLGR